MCIVRNVLSALVGKKKSALTRERELPCLQVSVDVVLDC
jgi:hypothetical protein